MLSSIFKVFCNAACVAKSCKLNIFFLFSFDFLLIRILCIKMLDVFQTVEIYSWTDAGLSLEYQNIQDIFYINILFSLHKGFYKQVVSTHPYLMVCVRTAKDARCKPKV